MPTGFIEIIDDACKGCELCVAACPKGLIHYTRSHLNRMGHFPVEFQDPEGVCNACRLCAVVCPDVAIRVYRAVKKKRDAPAPKSEHEALAAS